MSESIEEQPMETKEETASSISVSGTDDEHQRNEAKKYALRAEAPAFVPGSNIYLVQKNMMIDRQVIKQYNGNQIFNRQKPQQDRYRATVQNSNMIPMHVKTIKDSSVSHGSAGVYRRNENNMKTGIDFDKFNSIPVEVSGQNPPPAVQNFQTSNLDSTLLENLQAAGFITPTPIQKHSIPIGEAKRDLMACAQTGSGKTGAFLFPIINHLLCERNALNRLPLVEGGTDVKIASPSALILAPTRELASQIFEECLRFTKNTSINSVVVYGGASIQHQINQLTRSGSSVHICVATPGRLIDLRERGVILFENVSFFVLDEADRMLDMGFEPQIRRICEGFDFPNKLSRTTSMFSATFPNEIQKLASDFLKDYIFVTVGVVGGAAQNVKQGFTFVQNNDYLSKRAALMRILQSTPCNGLVLVFVETKKKCDELCRDVRNIFRIKCGYIHGDRTQIQREKALYLFATRRVHMMIATDVASRGLDIPDVEHVINFDMPHDIDSYVHRIGRTGRAGNRGKATAILTPDDAKVSKTLVRSLKQANQEIPPWLLSLSQNPPRQHNRTQYYQKNRQQPKQYQMYSHQPYGFSSRDARNLPRHQPQHQYNYTQSYNQQSYGCLPMNHPYVFNTVCNQQQNVLNNNRMEYHVQQSFPTVQSLQAQVQYTNKNMPLYGYNNIN